MARIAIDLLPIEFRAEEVKRAKFYNVQVAGVATILLVTFLASLTMALRILQSRQISQIQSKLTAAEHKISGLKTTQASLLLLKNRLTAINQYMGTSSKQVEMYELINQLFPPSVAISQLSVDRSGEILVLAVALDSNSLDALITNLISKETNQDKVSQVILDNINRGRDGAYRISVKIKPK